MTPTKKRSGARTQSAWEQRRIQCGWRRLQEERGSAGLADLDLELTMYGSNLATDEQQICVQMQVKVSSRIWSLSDIHSLPNSSLT